MSLKFPCLVSLVCLTSCLEDDHPQRIEKWYVEEWEVSGFSWGCSFEGPEDQEKGKSIIIETLLGLEDSVFIETELHLESNGEMHIIKGDFVALSGTWDNSDPHILSIAAKDQFCNFEMVSKNKDSLVLRTRDDRYLGKVEIKCRPD